MCTTESLIDPKAMKFLTYNVTKEPTTWETGGENFTSREKICISDLALPCFTTKRKFSNKFHILPPKTNSPRKYALILGMDLLSWLGLVVDLKEKTLTWDGVSIPMVPHGHWKQENINRFLQGDQRELVEETYAVQHMGADAEVFRTILTEAIYEATNLEDVVKGSTQ